MTLHQREGGRAMTCDDIENRDDLGGDTDDVKSASKVSFSETPEQFGQQVARELLNKSFNTSKADSESG